jgi:hypothetical protein
VGLDLYLAPQLVLHMGGKQLALEQHLQGTHSAVSHDQLCTCWLGCKRGLGQGGGGAGAAHAGWLPRHLLLRHANTTARL